MVFQFEEEEGHRWIPFTQSRSKFVYHGDEGWSGLHDIPMGNSVHRVTLGLALSNNDDLIEDYSGASLRFESRRLGTRRLAARIEVSRFRSSWRRQTLDALPPRRRHHSRSGATLRTVRTG